jgi:endonuclease/exonuclease/phosphatase family metal-dependent hydrolase
VLVESLGKNIPVVILGDFNSRPSSAVTNMFDYANPSKHEPIWEPPSDSPML